LYLWHAAILALFWTWNGGRTDAIQTAMLLVLIWVLAVISWRMVERPVRQGTWLKSNHRFLVVAATLNLVLGTVGFILWKVLPLSTP
jgi:peptidoglycan/LPS O-acetylase OafA/YrhL